MDKLVRGWAGAVRAFATGATLFISLGLAPSVALASGARHVSTSRFGGVWHVDWCEPGRTNCGGFTAYLVQRGNRLCGSHYGADPRQVRLDEGDPRSIIGTAHRSGADVEITSSRNNEVVRARLTRMGRRLVWSTKAIVREGTNGEPAFIPDRDVLRPLRDSESLGNLTVVARQCDAKDGT